MATLSRVNNYHRRQQHCPYPADLISLRMRVNSYKNSR